MVTATAPKTVSAAAAECRRVTVLGSTGTIGCNTLDLLRGEEADIVALTAHSNAQLLIEQALAFQPEHVVIADDRHYRDVKDALAGTGIGVAAGDAAVSEAAARPSDWVMAGIVGAAGLAPTLEAVRQGATVALANKECLVCAGPLFLDEVRGAGATLLPVDSEHNAIFQVFDFDRAEAVERIILTASGGPFRCFSRDEMKGVTPEEAVRHPNWTMGAKISVDSATMMNKGLELIEAAYLFPLPSEQIDILVHPQSIVHGLVQYNDGSMLAQMGSPDMRTPIAYALAWPKRMPAPCQRLDLAAIGQLTFEAPDTERFPSIALARQALKSEGCAPTLLNAANEVAVDSFLRGEIGFLHIADIVEGVLAKGVGPAMVSLEDVMAADSLGRRLARDQVADIVRRHGE